MLEKFQLQQYNIAMNYDDIINRAKNKAELEQTRILLLGKKSALVNAMQELGKLTLKERKIEGTRLNKIKEEITQKLEKKQLSFTQIDVNEIDYTFPFSIAIGRKHIITQAIEKLHIIFAKAGFDHIIGPDIEDVYYNFEALNIAIEHPARDNNDTFYMQQDGKLLRTHVTAVQIRLLEAMKNNPRETRSYSIGRVYRNDAHDATHSCSFHQIEGIIIEDDVTMQHLKGFLEYLFDEFFEQKSYVRFRPSYFPFTEPSCEVDIFTQQINDKLTISKTGKALELGGCGIIHPTILEKFNQNGKQALAFGVGLERLIMIKHGISNLHDLYENHVPTLKYIALC